MCIRDSFAEENFSVPLSIGSPAHLPLLRWCLILPLELGQGCSLFLSLIRARCEGLDPFGEIRGVNSSLPS